MSIIIDAVSKRFGQFAALNDVSLEARPGEFLALLGPSGSGKTTLLRMIAGLDFPDSGHVLFDGADMTGTPAAERQIGFVFQNYALFRHMTVADNIAFGLTVRARRDRPAKADIRARVAELLDLIQLPDLGHRYPAQLSGGQRQRVALARALAVEPRLLLLDEPFGALDAKVRKDLRRWLRELHDRLGLTSVFVTHDQEEALELADRVVIMNRGVIEQIGTPREVYDMPTTPFVSEFVGETNRIPVTVADGRVLHHGQALDVSPKALANGPAELHFRPHEALLGDDAPGALSIVVGAVHKRGGTWRVEARVDDIAVEIDTSGPLPERGARAGLRFDEVQIFPAA
ncbi:sulfate/molybdate ABC transporter ATP-binding protein [Sphingomonas aerolata]|uniref:sulfate/molybdate ABC transporter ATP-binding protein n=1 Tax=Sphingomonas aerolata TaxID=185951 RepID=UPI002FE1C611